MKITVASRICRTQEKVLFFFLLFACQIKKKSQHKIDLKHSLTTEKLLRCQVSWMCQTCHVYCERRTSILKAGLNFSCLSSTGCFIISVRCSFSAAAKSWVAVTFLESRLIRGAKGSNCVSVGRLTEALERGGTRAKQSATFWVHWKRKDFLLPSAECSSHL